MGRPLRSRESGGRVRLAAYLESAGEAIEADLAYRQINVGEEWRARRWRRLLNLIEHLPRNSAFVEVLANDETIAAAVDRAAPEDKARERLSEWSPEREMLVAIFDRLGSVIAALIAVNGGTPPKIPPYPRPVTALERVRHRQARTRHERLVDRLLNR